jgi:hypothetical protein
MRFNDFLDSVKLINYSIFVFDPNENLGYLNGLLFESLKLVK